VCCRAKYHPFHVLILYSLGCLCMSCVFRCFSFTCLKAFDKGKSILHKLGLVD
jgi:hypothetical protein